MPPVSGGAAAARRGEIWWVEFDPTGGSEIRKTRPTVVVTADALNRVRRTVVVVPLSSGPQPHPPIVVAAPSAGPGSVAVCDQIRAVDRRRLVRSDGRLSLADLHAIEPACGRFCSWEPDRVSSKRVPGVSSARLAAGAVAWPLGSV